MISNIISAACYVLIILCAMFIGSAIFIDLIKNVNKINKKNIHTVHKNNKYNRDA